MVFCVSICLYLVHLVMHIELEFSYPRAAALPLLVNYKIPGFYSILYGLMHVDLNVCWRAEGLYLKDPLLTTQKMATVFITPERISGRVKDRENPGQSTSRVISILPNLSYILDLGSH